MTMQNLNSINTWSYLQDVLNRYRAQTEQKNKDALIENLSADFSHLTLEEQELMKDELLYEIQKCKSQLDSTKEKDKKFLEKDLQLFSILAKELEIDITDSKRIKSDLDTLNKALQEATDDPLRLMGKTGFQSPITQQKYEELENLMKQQLRGKYSRSILFQELWDYLEGILSWKKSFENENKAFERGKSENEQVKGTENEQGEGPETEKNIVIEEFDDSDYWVYFARYCKENGITRADGKEIPWRGGMDTSIIYLDKDRNPLKLIFLNWWAGQDDDVGASGKYVLVKEISYKDQWEDEVKALEDEVKALEDEVKVSEEFTWTYDFNLNASLSEMENIHLDNARYAVEDALKAEYHQVSKRNVFKKAGLWLQRGRMRKKRIDELMKKNIRLPFTGDEKLNSSLAHATNRHETEKQLWLWNIEWTEILDIPEVNQLAQDYIEWNIDDSVFESRFNDLLQHNEVLFAAVKDVSHLGTNILQKLKLEKAQYQLVSELAQALEIGTSVDQVQVKIEQFLKDYQKTPDFLKDIQADLNEKNLEKLKKYFNHQKAIRAMALKNLKMKLSVFTGGKSAYQIDNTDREKGWVYRLGQKLDKIPRYVQVPGYMWLGAVLGLAGGPLGLGVVGTSILTTTTFAGATGFMNFVKKWTHHTKEQNTHEKELTRDYDNQQKLIQQWKDATMKKGAKNWFKRYKAKRQLELYDQTTQQNMVKTKEVNETLLAFATSLRPLSEGDRQELLAFLMSAKARLQVYWKTGHNFLASTSPEEVETDMDQLHQILLLAADKLGITFEEIDNQMIKKADDEEMSYQDMLEELQTDYTSASKKFKKQRAWLATKYGLGTAALSAGTALWLQALMWTGAFASDATIQHSEVARNLATSDQFWLWSHELINGNQIQHSVAEQFKNLTDAGDKVIIHYGSGTDATLVKAGSLLNDPSAYQAKLQSVADQIQNLHLTAGQKSAFLNELTNKSWELDWSKAFTNDYLQGDRCAEGLLQMAKGLEASGNTTLIPELSYDAAKSIAWSALHNAWERMFTAGMQITDITASEVAWSGSTWRFPITGFFNTFKDKNLEEQSQEQKEGETDLSTEEKLSSENDDLPSSEVDSLKHRTQPDSWQKIVIPRGFFDDTPESEESISTGESPTTKESVKKWVSSFREKTKEKSSAFAESFKKKYQEKAPVVKEKSKQAWEKTKDVSKRVVSATSDKIKDFKKRLNEKNSDSTPMIIEKSDFNVDELDFDNNIYVVHQTHSSNVESIVDKGLETKNGLNGAALFANKESLVDTLGDIEAGHGHKGSDALVIMEFPRDTFKTGEKITLDDISDLLIKKWEFQSFELPPHYIKAIVKVKNQ